MVNCTPITLCAFVTSAVIIFAFGVSVISLIGTGNAARYESKENGLCGPVSTNLTYFELKKQIFEVVHWQYKMQNTQGGTGVDMYWKQAWYTHNHDVLSYGNGRLVSSSDGKILSTTSDVYINDCEGNHLFLITTCNFWITLQNGNRIQVMFQARDMSGKTIGYIQGLDAFRAATQYTIRDANGNEVVYATKDISSGIMSGGWVWKVSVKDTTSPIADMRILPIIFVHASFAEGGTDDKGKHVNSTDVANNYIFWAGIMDLIALIIWIIFTVWFLYEDIKNCISCWRSCCCRERRIFNMLP